MRFGQREIDEIKRRAFLEAAHAAETEAANFSKDSQTRRILDGVARRLFDHVRKFEKPVE